MFHIYANSMLAASKLDQFQHHPNEWQGRKEKRSIIRDFLSGPKSTIFHGSAKVR